jgi:hypothetical protein
VAGWRNLSGVITAASIRHAAAAAPCQPRLPGREFEAILAKLGRKHMAHDHSNEYQVKIVHEDGAEELSGWMKSEEQVVQAVGSVYRAQGKTYWLRERSVLCPDCSDRDQRIEEYLLANTRRSRMQPARRHAV